MCTGMVATPADVFIVSDPDDCEKLKKMVNTDDKDAKKEKSKTPMVVVLARSDKKNKDSSANKQEESKPRMDPRLLMALRTGDVDNLVKLLNGGVASSSSSIAGAAMLLNGVTLDSQGDSALHVVAASGDSPKYLYCAKEIIRRAKHLLMDDDARKNKKGDTPVHCAARAGNYNMVDCLIKMAAAERGDDNSNKKVELLLRKENNVKETALHCAIRSYNFMLTKMLVSKDPELARTTPKDGISPLYLAISLGLILDDERLEPFESCRSCIEQSWSGPHGQNVLHLAVWRDVFHGKGTVRYGTYNSFV